MKNFLKTSKLLAVGLALVISACTSKKREENKIVFSLSPKILASLTAQCYAINIMGEGIGTNNEWTSNKSIFSSSPNAYSGTIINVTSTSETITVEDVPEGEKIIQLVYSPSATDCAFTTSGTIREAARSAVITPIAGKETNVNLVITGTNTTDVRAWNAPGSFSITSSTVSSGQVTLQWSSSTSATSYDVKYGTTSGTWSTTATNVTGTSATITGLANGTPYFFMVSAKNSSMVDTNASGQASATPMPAPGAFSISSATPSNAQVTLVWGASASATNYSINFGTTSGTYNLSGGSTASTTITVSGLTNGTPYFFMVTAENAAGSTNANAQVTATPLAAPAAFTISSAAPSDSQVLLSWNSSSGASSYIVNYGTTSGTYGSTIGSITATSATIGSLTNGTTYYFMVVASNSFSQTNASAQVSATPMPAPGAFTISSASPGVGQVSLVWGASASATSYDVKYGTTSGTYGTTFAADVTGTSSTVTGLTNGTPYFFMVTAKNAVAQTNASSPASATPEATPGAFTISSATPNDSQVALAWGASASATSYVVKYGTTSGTYGTTFGSTSSTSSTVTGLTNGTTYYFMVTASNTAAATNATAQVSATPMPPPGAFTIASATAGNTQVTLSWTASSSATLYDVKYGTTSGTYNTTFSSISTTSETITGLTNGTTYYFMVTAVNDAGSTDATSQASAVPTASLAWSQQAFVKAANSNASDRFGHIVSISGDTMVVGVPNEDSNENTITNGTTASSNNGLSNTGAVYVYRLTSGSWAQEAYIKAPNVDPNDGFGFSVDIDGDTIVVGARVEDSNQTTITNGTTASSNNSAADSGAVYVFKRTGTTWAQEAYIKASNAEAGDGFGQSVAIHGDTIVVGADAEDASDTTITNGSTASSNNSATDAGAVYVYKRTGSNWAEEAYLKPSNLEADDTFGYHVDINGDTIVVGAPYEDSNQNTITNGGSASGNNSNTDSGAVYVFKRSGSNWSQESYLKAPNNGSNDGFGWNVSIDTDTIVVGAPFEESNQTTITNGTTGSSDNSEASAGAVYVFKRSGANWSQEAYIKASNAAASDFFGYFVGISGDRIVTGAYADDSNQTTITNGGGAASNDDSATDAGSAFIFRRSGTTWSAESYLKAANAQDYDAYGRSVAISGSTVVVGAYLEDSNDTSITNGTTASSNNSISEAGAVYIYLGQ